MNCEEGHEGQRVNMSQGARVRRRQAGKAHRVSAEGSAPEGGCLKSEGIHHRSREGGSEKEVGYEGARKGSPSPSCVDDLLSVVIIQTPMLDALIDRLGCSERSGSNIMLLM